MSRVFVAASSKQLGPATLIKSGVRDEPLTIASTVSIDNGIAQHMIAAVYHPSTPFHWFALTSGVVAGNLTFGAQTRQSFRATSSANVSLGSSPWPRTWYRCVARFFANNDRRIAVNGGYATNSTTRAVSGCSSLTIGSVGGAQYFDAGIGETAFWSSALSADETTAWLDGVPAEGISPSTLVYRYPIDGFHSPEEERIQGKTLTVVNNPVQGVSHPFSNSY